MAEAGAREVLELELHNEMTELRHLLLRSQRRVWAAASLEELQTQVVLSRWPAGEVFLQQAVEAESLTAVGMVLTGVQNLYNTYKNDWGELKESLVELEKELVSQSHQMAVNFRIVLNLWFKNSVGLWLEFARSLAGLERNLSARYLQYPYPDRSTIARETSSHSLGKWWDPN